MPISVRTALVALLFGVVLASCGGGPTDPGDTTDPTVAVTPSDLTIVQGETGAVTVSVSDFGTADVALDVTGLPDGVDATFDPETLTGGATESTLTLAVDASADEGEGDLTIFASSAGDDATATVTLTVASTPPELAVAVAPDSLSIAQGESDVASVTISGGTGADVALSAENVPSGVEVAFDPSTLTGSAPTATATVTVDATASATTTDITIVASQDGTDATTTLSLSVDATAVEGRVVTLFDQGIPGLSVAIDDQIVSTGLDGTFTIEGVIPPYDLVVFRTGEDPVAHVFEGLETLEPTVLPLSAIQGGSLGLPTGTIEGTLFDAPPIDHETVVCAEGTLGATFGCGTVSNPNDAYSVGTTWTRGVATSVRLHALERELGTNDLPVAYTGYAVGEPVLLYNGDTLADVDVPAFGAALDSVTVGGTVSMPTGFEFASLAGAAGVSSSFQMSAFQASTTPISTLSTDISVPLPVLGEDAYAFLAIAQTPEFAQTIGWTGGVAGGATDVSMSLPAPPTMVVPADGATGVNVATEFVLDSAQDSVRTFLFQPPFGVDGPNIAVTTEAERTTLPDLAYLDPALAIPSSETYEWGAIESNTVATLEGDGATRWIQDYFAVQVGIVFGGPLTVESGTITTTATREFTAD